MTPEARAAALTHAEAARVALESLGDVLAYSPEYWVTLDITVTLEALRNDLEKETDR